MLKFAVIVAVGLNGVIGDTKNNKMPWHLPEDLKFFKKMTVGQTVVMGANTFDSIGKLLPQRRNIVITRSASKAFNFRHVSGVDDVYNSLQDVMLQELPGFFIIGGGQIYAEALTHKPDVIYATIVHQDFDGDVVFPITGRQLLADQVEGYTCVSLSAIKEYNGTRYQFAELRLNDSVVY